MAAELLKMPGNLEGLCRTAKQMLDHPSQNEMAERLTLCTEIDRFIGELADYQKEQGQNSLLAQSPLIRGQMGLDQTKAESPVDLINQAIAYVNEYLANYQG